MQIETLLNEERESAQSLMAETTSGGKASIALSKLINVPKKRSDIPAVKRVQAAPYEIRELENGTIEVEKDGSLISPAKTVLRELALANNLSLLNNNGNPFNTRQLGSMVINALLSKSTDSD